MAGLHYLHRLGAGQQHAEDNSDRISAYPQPGRKAAQDWGVPVEKPFFFNKNRIDWRVLHGVNLHILAETTDVDALERCLQAGLANGDLEAEDPSTLTLTNVLRVARLCQLAIQYFIATQGSLVSEVSNLQTAKDASEAARAKAEDKNHVLLARHKKDSQALRDLQNLLQQIEVTTPNLDDKPTFRPSSEVIAGGKLSELHGMSKDELIQVLRDFYDQHANTINISQDEVDRLRSSNADKDSMLNTQRETLQRELDELRTQLAQEQEASKADKTNLAALNKKQIVMERSMNLMKDEIRRLRQRPVPLPDTGMEEALRTKQNALDQLQQELGSTTCKWKEARQEAETVPVLQARLAELEGRHRAAKDELKRVQLQRDRLQDRNNDAKTELAKLQNAYEHHRLEAARMQEEIKKAREGHDALLKKHKDMQAESERETARLQRQVDEGHRRLVAAKHAMDLARQDVDKAKLDMETAHRDIDLYIASRPAAAAY